MRRIAVKKVAVVLICLCLAPWAGWSADFSGKVVGVTDGDTIEVLRDITPVKIRLNGIDCPESHQGFGQKAKQFTSDLVFGKTVSVRDLGQDKYGRTLGDITLPDGKLLNQEIVRAGMAWWYWKYSQDKSLGMLEVDARAARAGLWSDANAVPPWLFRRGQEEVKEPSPEKSSVQPAPLFVPMTSTPARQEPQVRQKEVVVYMTRTGSKYHREGCRYLAKSKISIDVSDAAARGLGPCSVCNPPSR